MNFINETELRKIVSKLELYSKDEQLIIASIKDIYNNMAALYSTSNKDNLWNITTDLSLKADIISDTHHDYITVFNKNMEKYIDVTKGIESKFEDIG